MKYELTETQIRNIINETVSLTVLKLKITGLLKDNKKTAYQKTEELLKNYNDFCSSDQPYAQKLVKKIDDALTEIENDIYCEIIPLYYFENETRENIAEYYNTTVTTVSRNKSKLINKLKIKLFSDDVIYELFL